MKHLSYRAATPARKKKRPSFADYWLRIGWNAVTYTPSLSTESCECGSYLIRAYRKTNEAFCEKFLEIQAAKVVHLRPVSIEYAIESYVEFTSDMFGTPQFSDERIQDIAKKSGKSEAEIRELLTRAIRKQTQDK